MSADETVDAGLFGDAEVGVVTHLRAASCDACGRWTFPAREWCPGCGAATEPARLEGPARLRAVTGVRAQPPGSRVEAPYEVGVAEFPHGLCVIGLIDGTAAIGDPVVPVVAAPYDGGRTFAFRLHDSTESPGGDR